MPGHASPLPWPTGADERAGAVRNGAPLGVLKPVLDPTKRPLTPLLTRWSANGSDLPDPYRTSVAMRWMTASGKRIRPFSSLCATTSWRTATRCRRISTASWKRSENTTGRWWAGMNLPSRSAQKHSDQSGGAGCAGTGGAERLQRDPLDGFYLDQPQSTAYHYRNGSFRRL